MGLESGGVVSHPIHIRGRATFEELFEVFAEGRGVPLVGRADADGGPYTHCIRVDVHDIDAYCKKGYRPLSPGETEAALTTLVDFDGATD